MVFLAIALCACLVVFGLSRIDRFGNGFANKIYMGPHGQLGMQEQFTADLKKALRLKSEKAFSEALHTVKNLLIKDPNWAEALLLKAQILDEAYGNKEAAKYILKKIMQMKPDNIEATHSAATYLYEELCAGEIRKQ
jgi:tetratricopeptide (TPR) repeat protein